MNDLITHFYYFQVPLSVFLFHLFFFFFFFLLILISISSSKSCGFSKNLHLGSRFIKCTSNFSKILFISSSSIIFFLFQLFLVLLTILVFFISLNIFFKPFISSLNSSIIIYFFERVKGKDIFGIFCYDLVPKRLYSISIPLKRDIE